MAGCVACGKPKRIFATHCDACIAAEQTKQGARQQALPSPPLATATSAKQVNPVGLLFSLILVGGMVWYFAMGGMEHEADRQLQNINTKVATDFAAQYDIAKRSGSPTDACVAAGIAAAGALQAKDEGGYQRWKSTEKADCARAGIPK